MKNERRVSTWSVWFEWKTFAGLSQVQGSRHCNEEQVGHMQICKGKGGERNWQRHFRVL